MERHQKGLDDGRGVFECREDGVSVAKSRHLQDLARGPEPQRAIPLPRELARAEQQPFVGRSAALQQLRERWEEASLGHGGLIVLGGEPGIGKTRLAARIAVEAHAEGSIVLYGRAEEEGVSRYQPFVEALRHYVAHQPGLAHEPGLETATQALAALVPELAARPAPAAEPGDDEDQNRQQLFEAMLQVLLHAARSRPLLVILDDLHLADVPTVQLLRQMPRRGAASPLLVVATYSDVEAETPAPLANLLADLRRESMLDRIAVRGFDPSETATLVAVHGGSSDADLAERLCDETGGNPFFIEELLRSRAEAPDAVAGVPEGVKDVIGRRLDRLPPEAVETLTLAAVLGTDFRLATLQIVENERDPEDLIASLEAAVAAGLIAEDPEEVDRFSFMHALVRETLYERPILSRRLRLHRRVAEALEAAPLKVHPAELAHHYFQARRVGGAGKAIVYTLKAGEAAHDVHAYEEAARQYERALAALEIVRADDAAARCDVMLALGAARWQASVPDRSATFVQAVELARGLGSEDRLARAALGAGGRFYAPGAIDRPEIELLDEALDALSPGDSALRVRVLARLAENLVFVEPLERARALADEAVEMARRLGEPHALAAALMARHAALLHADHADDRRRLAEEVLALAGELGVLEMAALGRHWLLYDLAELGEREEAQRRHAELEHLAKDLQQPLYRHSSLAWRSVWAALAGRFDEAERWARDSVGLADRAHAPDAHKHFTAQLAALRREQGRLHELLPEIERYAGEEPTVGPWRGILPLAYLDAGDRARARAAYDGALDGGVEAIPRTMFWLAAVGSLAEAAALLGDADGGAQLYAALEPHADRLVQWSFTGSAGSVHRLLGRTAAVAGRHEDARDHFEDALRRHAELGAAPLLARTRCDYGELLLDVSPADGARARELLCEAHVAARELGMAGVSARTGTGSGMTGAKAG